MGRTAKPMSTGEVYAPLLKEHVDVPMLDIERFYGRKLSTARDAMGEPIRVPAEAGMTELRRRIEEPGRYRVAARDPATGNDLVYSDHDLQPLDEGGSDEDEEANEPMPEQTSRSMPWREVSEHAYVGHLHDTINNLRDQLREAASRAERDVRYERERADSVVKEEKARADEMLKALQARTDAQLQAVEAKVAEENRSLRERCDAAVKFGHDAEVKLAAYTARLDASEANVDRLEAQLAELKDEVDGAREVAAELKRRSEEKGFSPLEAMAELDQALDLLTKTFDRVRGE